MTIDKIDSTSNPHPSANPPRARVLAMLSLGVLAVSMAAIFIRFAQQAGATSLAIAAGRMLIAALIMVPIALVTCGAELRKLTRADWLKGIAVGGLLAIHFWAWIESLNHISVALSTVLVTTTPIWTALGAWGWRGELITPRQLLGLSLAVVGSIALALLSGQIASKGNFFLGMLLALIGAWAIAGNLLIGQGLRQQLPVRAYAAMVYGAAALWLVLAVMITGTSLFNLSTSAYLYIFALAIFPQLLGHTALNWALPYLGATTVAVSVLGEPIGAALIATWLLNEPISFGMALCFALTLCGIVLVASGGVKNRSK